jgi:transposase
MVHQSVRKTYKYKLRPTPLQARTLETVLWHCRMLYNTALEERKTDWERYRVSVNYYQQKAELPDLKAACPEYAEVNAQVLQDVILRVERAYQAFFCRLRAGEQPGYPRFIAVRSSACSCRRTSTSRSVQSASRIRHTIARSVGCVHVCVDNGRRYGGRTASATSPAT